MRSLRGAGDALVKMDLGTFCLLPRVRGQPADRPRTDLAQPDGAHLEP